MKPSALSALIVICVTAAIAGWALARADVYARHEAIDESARREAQEKSRIPARYFSSLVRTADHAVIVYRSPEGEREVHVDDPVWLLRLSVIVGGAAYETTPHALWISTPEIRLYRENEEVLTMMSLGSILRCYGNQKGGDFVVGGETIRALTVLVDAKVPALAATPARP